MKEHFLTKAQAKTHQTQYKPFLWLARIHIWIFSEQVQSLQLQFSVFHTDQEGKLANTTLIHSSLNFLENKKKPQTKDMLESCGGSESKHKCHSMGNMQSPHTHSPFSFSLYARHQIFS